MAASPRTVISRLVFSEGTCKNFFAAAAVFEWRKSACFKVWCGNVVDPCLVSSEYPSITPLAAAGVPLRGPSLPRARVAMEVSSLFSDLPVVCIFFLIQSLPAMICPLVKVFFMF